LSFRVVSWLKEKVRGALNGGTAIKDTCIFAPTNNCGGTWLYLLMNGLNDKVVIKTPGDYGGLKSPEYLKINPQGKFPALVSSGSFAIYESAVIFAYLVDTYGDDAKYGVRASNPRLQARCNLLCRVHDMYVSGASCTTAPIKAADGDVHLNHANLKAVYNPNMTLVQRSAMAQDLKKQLDELERLMDSEGPWAVGSEMTLADFVMYPTWIVVVHISPRTLNWGPFENRPKMKAWYAKCEEFFGGEESPGKDLVNNIKSMYNEGLSEQLTKIKADIDENGKDLIW
jgi:glutathione S-transferase